MLNSIRSFIIPVRLPIHCKKEQQGTKIRYQLTYPNLEVRDEAYHGLLKYLSTNTRKTEMRKHARGHREF
ncbi:MAG: hypothetical protein OXC40_02960 [Proteobacteria bacterium]|nr:hypothetical protein [Pseudomonadota bacterium]